MVMLLYVGRARNQLLNKNSMKIAFPCGELLYPNFAEKRHGCTKKWKIFSYFFFLLTMTFYFLNVMVDEII